MTDVWKSKEAFEEFARDKISPITQEVGVSPPTINFFEVHNYLTSG